MARPPIFAALALVVALPALVHAQSGRPLRLMGDAVGAAEPAPKAFVVDATLAPGDSEATATISGWFAATTEPAASGEVTGTCVEIHCALTADLDGSKFILTGDFGAAAAPVAVRFLVKDGDGKTTQSGAASLRPLSGPLAGLGILAEPGAITQAQFDELLVWGHATVSTGSPPGEDPPTSFQREALATWQNGKGRLATGLIFAADLAELTADEAAQRKAAGWTALTLAPGWRAGYPAALLPLASQGPGAKRRFASTDGKAVLEIAFDPPMSEADFDDLVKQVGADRPGRDKVSLTRVNSDMELSYREDGVITVAAWHSRESGLARLVFTYPDAAADRYSPFDTILTRALAETR